MRKAKGATGILTMIRETQNGEANMLSPSEYKKLKKKHKIKIKNGEEVYNGKPFYLKDL